MIAGNIAIVNERIRKAAERSGRNAEEIKIICVTKGRTVEEIKEAIRCGITEMGENRVQEAVAKYSQLTEVCHPEGAKRPKDLLKDSSGTSCLQNDIYSSLRLRSGAQDDKVYWHMVGHLQTNKVRDAVRMFDLIHSLDSLKLAKEIDKEAAKIDKIQDMLIEVNTSGEAAKFGVAPDGLMGMVKEVISLKNIRLLGLMTIAPIVRDKEEARPYFRKLRELRDCFVPTGLPSVVGLRPPRNDVIASPEGAKQSLIPQLSLPVLSMGMSRDYEVAVEEGATLVRIGTAIFEN